MDYTPNRKQLLNPFVTIAKLCILSFLPIGTKLYIHDNIMTFDPPNSFQFAMRYYRSESRDNIQMLYNPIKKYIEWYILNNPFSDNDKSKKIIDTFTKLSIKGLNTLKYTYGDGIIVLTIQLFINYLNNALDGKLDNSEFVESFEKITPSVQKDIIIDITDFDVMKQITQLLILCETEKNKKKNVNEIIESIITLLKKYDLQFQQVVSCINSDL